MVIAEKMIPQVPGAFVSDLVCPVMDKVIAIVATMREIIVVGSAFWCFVANNPTNPNPMKRTDAIAKRSPNIAV